MVHSRLTVMLMLAAMLAGCYPATRITGSWKNPAASRSYHTLFIAALSGNTVARSTIEKEMAAALQKRSMTAIKSMDEFPPVFAEDSISRAELMERVRETNADAILTVAIQKKETETRYVSGGYTPLARWDYYGTFWGYYSYWGAFGYRPGYYQEQDVYYLETNLYDTGNGQLLWSAQSKTIAFDGLPGLAREFSATVVDKMREDGVLR